jgi:hypothetical protein
MRRDHKAAGAGSVAGAHGSTMATGKGQPGCDGDGRWGETHHLPRSSRMAQTQDVLARAATLTATNSPRPPASRWSARATSSLKVPMANSHDTSDVTHVSGPFSDLSSRPVSYRYLPPSKETKTM